MMWTLFCYLMGLLYISSTDGKLYLQGINNGKSMRTDESREGWWIRDSPRSDKIYKMSYSISLQSFEEFENENDLRNGRFNRRINFQGDDRCAGAGHVMFNGSFYCNKYRSPNIMKRQIYPTFCCKQERPITDAGHSNSYHYQWGGYSDIDFALDERGLWVLYSTAEAAANIIIGRVDPDTLEITSTFTTSFDKRRAAEAFMIDGTLYVLDRYTSPRYITYFYDTDYARGGYLGDAIPWPNSMARGRLTQLAYVPGRSELYVWDNTHLQTLPISLTTDVPKWAPWLTTPKVTTRVPFTGTYITTTRPFTTRKGYNTTPRRPFTTRRYNITTRPFTTRGSFNTTKRPFTTRRSYTTARPFTTPPRISYYTCACDLRLRVNCTDVNQPECNLGIPIHPVSTENIVAETGCNGCLKVARECPSLCFMRNVEFWGVQGLSRVITEDTPWGPRNKKLGQAFCERINSNTFPPGGSIIAAHKMSDCDLDFVHNRFDEKLCCIMIDIPGAGEIPAWDFNCNGVIENYEAEMAQDSISAANA
ncbi:unnamed protein product [Owenia fusiformis]|uniref:Olfactomedin-like domain-containing protein n=1 Tax=Owenia fusiformis TaxID=6347 RepID=A0A8S4P5W9_OWEFU|nr:unnamed protein product [Owenia fusiformis]